MKMSKRNMANAKAKADKLKQGKPKLSKFARKFVPETREEGLQRQREGS